MTDIVKRLRETIQNTLRVSAEGAEPALYPNCADAAAEIEKLRDLLRLSAKAFEAIPVAAKARRMMKEEFGADAPPYSGNRSHVLAKYMAEMISKRLV